MRIPTPVALLLLTLGAAASWWISQPETEGPAAPAQFTQPGYYLNDAFLEETDNSGRLTLKVHAATARQLEQRGPVLLNQLKVDYLPSPDRDWRMTSVGGTLLPDGRQVLLAGDVRLAAPSEGAAVVRTEHLRLDVDKEVATTDDPVRIEMPLHSVDARGLRADLKRETLRLESSVDGTFTR
jgi:lipopolysaccharide export system protein LptC